MHKWCIVWVAAASLAGAAQPVLAQSTATPTATIYQTGRGGKAMVGAGNHSAMRTANGSTAHSGTHGSGYNGKNSAAYSGRHSSGTYNKNTGAYNVNGTNYQCSGTVDAQGNCVKK